MGKSNVNPDHYKTGGRERQGDDVAHDRERQEYAQEEARIRFEKRANRGAPANPGAKPAGRSPATPKKKTTAKGVKKPVVK